jgi:chaperone BCS1
LSEADITEAELGRLFTQLPRRCVVLLEDIDSAGIRREEDLPSESPASESGATEDSVEDAPKEDHGHKNKSMFSRLLHTIGIRLWISPVPETTKPDEAADEDDSSKDSTKTPRGQRGKSNITLAGLLNIIDGAASHEVSQLLHHSHCMLH